MASDPVVLESEGRHNGDLQASRARLIQGASYLDLSTVMLLPTRDGVIPDRVHHSINSLIRPMNQGHYYLPLWNLAGFEVADAYNEGIKQILADPGLSKFMFVLTMESDNLPPPDGLVKLQAAMYAHVDRDIGGRVILYEGRPKFHYAGMGGLYWTKGEGGMPMIYGDPKSTTPNFLPQQVQVDSIQPCRGIAQGFSLFALDVFKDKRLGPPWFRTRQEWDPAKGISMGTQDLDFAARAGELGYQFCVNTSVKVGHLDVATQVVW